MRIWSGAQIKLCYSNMFHLRRTWRLLRSPFLRLRCSGEGGLANGWIMGQYDDCLDALHIRPSELHAPERQCVETSPWHDILGSSLYIACFSLVTMRPPMLVWLIATLLLGHVMADLATEKRNSKIEGTWSSGAGNVMTGQNETGVAFFNPMRRHFTVPPTAGYSYSFTKDGHFEMAQFTYQTNPKDVHCFSASLVWQHGTYKYDGTNIYMSPYKGDGAIQTMGECLDPQVQMNYYAEKEVGANVTVYTDNDIVFYPGESMYVLQMHKFNGKPLPKMYLRYRPPRMMPTRSIFKQVIGAPG